MNQPAHDFVLNDQDGKSHRLSDYRGQWVLLYFYPKDMTPGCTTQACSLRDAMNDLKENKLRVLGVSCDNIKSHKKFADKYQLNFPLLADEEKKVVMDYGVWVEKSMLGKKYMGIQRDSFLIDPDGNIAKHYVNVKPDVHVAEVLNDLKSLQ